MLFFWYCFDDWLAAATGTPWLGAVPWIVVLLMHFIILPFVPKQNVTVYRGRDGF